MMARIPAKITGVAHYVPPRVVTNADLERVVDTTDKWIVERTGIRQRHFVEPGVSTSDLSLEATRRLLRQTGVAAEELDLIVVATITPDMVFPSTACVLQEKLGAPRAWGFDLSAACSGFVYGLTVGAQFVACHPGRKALVVGADVMTSILDFNDRATCVLFGDGAGAALVEACEDDEEGILDFIHDVDGSGARHLHMPAGGSRRPTSRETVEQRMHYVRQEGPQVFKYAVRRMIDVPQRLLERNGLRAEDLDLFVPHQANLRIINAAADKLSLNGDRVLVNIDRFGNTTAGTIPIALSEAAAKGRLKKGDLVMLLAVGAGYTTGGVLLRWAY
jgi:3-oxoacyl-[acyl-carrier-protein] synthase-3